MALDPHADFLTKLAAVCARNGPQLLSVSLHANGQTLIAETDATGTPRIIDPLRASQVPAGCLAKPITACLLAEAVTAHRVDWDTEVHEILSVQGTARQKLSGVRLGHLLDHSHGLDSALVNAGAPKTDRGFLDVTALCEHLAARRLSEPGELYSYGNTGAGFAGAVLERISGRQYGDLLEESPLFAHNSSRMRLHPPRACPATGDTLELTSAQWLLFLEPYLHAQSGRTSPIAPHLASLLRQRITMPGWSPAEQAACLGWKYYGSGWYGHNANMTTTSALLRFNPRQRMAIAVAGSNDTAYLTLAGLLGTALPEFANLRIPRLLKSQPGESRTTDPYIGSYSHGPTRVEVMNGSQGCLSVSFQSRVPGSTLIQGRLRPA
jgi:CubicO group peptidase (beta-lactamase class C family)